MRRSLLAVLVATTLVAACSGSDEASTPTTGRAPATTRSTTSTTATTTTTAPAARYEADVKALADDDMEGRDNQTPASTRAQDHIIGQLKGFADPLGGDYRHPFDRGTNILAVIPGKELPDEYVVLGAHYDHLGRSCDTAVPADDVCNGAGDDAAGVASVLEIGRRIAADGPPRRSVVLALWDAEEDGLQGSAAYVRDPVVPLDQTVAYLNWDIQGVDLLPSLRSTTILVGAETGGAALSGAATRAAGGSTLDVVSLSLLFGQGRSDHATFERAGVPVVLFSDSTSACYHTAQDDLAHVDLPKLGRQIATGEALARDLASTDQRLRHVSGAPAATYEDARSMLAVVTRAEPDLGRFTPAQQATASRFRADLQAMVDAGPAAFGQDDVGTLLAGSATIVQLLTTGPCEAPGP